MTSESTQFKKWPVLAAGILGAFCVMIILLITSVEASPIGRPAIMSRNTPNTMCWKISRK